MANNGDVPTPIVDEEIVALRHSCNGYVGNLTRRYNELERLMLSNDNCSEVEKKYAQLEETYELYVKKFQALKEKLGEGPVAEKAILEFEAHNQNRMEFSQRVMEYKQGAKSKEVKSGHGESQVNVPSDNAAAQKIPGSSASSVGSRKSSTSSVRLRQAKLKQELARLKLKQLERKQALEKERAEFAHLIELLDAQNERECADLEVSMWQEEKTEHPSVKEEIIRPNWTSADKTGGSNIVVEGKISSENAIRISNVTRANEGTYTCLYENSDCSSVQLSVYEKVQYIQVGRTGEINCTSKSNPETTHDWYMNGCRIKIPFGVVSGSGRHISTKDTEKESEVFTVLFARKLCAPIVSYNCRVKIFFTSAKHIK